MNRLELAEGRRPMLHLAQVKPSDGGTVLVIVQALCRSSDDQRQDNFAGRMEELVIHRFPLKCCQQVAAHGTGVGQVLVHDRVLVALPQQPLLDLRVRRLRQPLDKVDPPPALDVLRQLPEFLLAILRGVRQGDGTEEGKLVVPPQRAEDFLVLLLGVQSQDCNAELRRFPVRRLVANDLPNSYRRSWLISLSCRRASRKGSIRETTPFSRTNSYTLALFRAVGDSQ